MTYLDHATGESEVTRCSPPPPERELSTHSAIGNNPWNFAENHPFLLSLSCLVALNQASIKSLELLRKYTERR